MTASIFGDRFLGRDKPAWWDVEGLHVFTEAYGVREVIERSGMDYIVHKVPVAANVGEIDGRSAPVTLPDRYAIMREPTADDPQWRHFGFAASRYTLLQNTEIADLLEPLNGIWPIESAGALVNGKTAFFCFNAGSVDIAGDEVKRYVVWHDTKDGGTSLNGMVTPVRTVCWNTLNAGIAAAIATTRIGHTSGVSDELDFRVQLLRMVRGAMDKVIAAFELMAHVRIPFAEARELIADAYPYPNRPAKATLVDELDGVDLEDYNVLREGLDEATKRWLYAKSRVDAYREGAIQLLMKFDDEYPRSADTGWAVYNAICETEDWRNGDNVGWSTLFGPRAAVKSDAYALVMAKR